MYKRVLIYFVGYLSLALGGCSPDTKTSSEATCTPGNQGCPCKMDGTCNTLSGVQMVCRDEQCVPPGEDVSPAFQISLSVEPAQVRGCELVLDDQDLSITAIGFDDTVQGQWMRRGPRVALVFISQSDQAIQANAISVEASVDSLADLTWINLKCIDRNGTDISDATLTFN